VSWPYGDLGYLPGDGTDPEGFVLDPNGAPGDPGRFWITHLDGSLIRQIPFADLHLAGEASHHLEVASGGTILALGLMEGSQAFSWDRVVCVRFDRYGEYRGMFNVGAALPTDPFLPAAWLGAMCQLPNGDILVGTRFSEYLIDNGDPNGRTYRYFVVRPPTAFASPAIETSEDLLAFPMQRATVSATESFTVRNAGGALLQINNIAIRGKGAAAFEVEGPTEMGLLPSYGLSSVPGSASKVIIRFAPASYGSYEAEVAISSNDPLEPEATVALSGLAVPSTFADSVVLAAVEIDPQATGLGAVTFGNDPQTLLLILHKGDSASQLVELGASRNAKGKPIGFDTTSPGILAELGHSGGALLQGSDGILWYGEGGSEDKRIIQRKPGGTTHVQTIPFAASPGGPRDYDFGPGQTSLVMAKLNASYLYMADLSKRTDGFWDIGAWKRHSYRGAAPEALAYWPHPGGPGDLMLLAESLFLLDGSGGSFWTPPFLATGKSRTIATGLDVRFLGRDPVSGDLYYSDSLGQLHQVEGLQDYPGFSPSADLNNDDSVDSEDLLEALTWRDFRDLTGDGHWTHLDLCLFGFFWQWKP